MLFKSYVFSSALHVLFVLLGWFVRWEVGGCTASVLWGVDFRICSRQHIAFLRSSPFSFFSMCFVSVHVIHPYSSMNLDIAWKKCFILSDKSEFHMINNLSRAYYTFTRCILTSFSVDEILLPRYVYSSTNFRGLPLRMEMAPSCLRHINCFICIPVACSRGYAEEILLGQVYLREVLDYLYSQCLL